MKKYLDSAGVAVIRDKVAASLADKLDASQALEDAGKVLVVGSDGSVAPAALTASDVGALPDDTAVPSALSELSGDSTHRTVTDAQMTAWDAKQNAIPAGTYDEAGAAMAVRAQLGLTEAKIPPQASAQNKLADKNFVNSSIATATATFRGTFDSTAALQAYTGSMDNNDYAFVRVLDATVPTQVVQYDRYKYDGIHWTFEYTLNNSSFTAEQWAAIQSGVDSAFVQQLGAHLANDSIHVTAQEKAAWSAKSDFSGAYADLTGQPSIPDELADLTPDSTHRTVTDAEKSAWNAKAAAPALVAAAQSGTLTPADNCVYTFTASDAVTISATADTCPLYGAELVVSVGTGGSLAISAVSVTGDDVTAAAEGDVWEISVLRGRAIAIRLSSAAD